MPTPIYNSVIKRGITFQRTLTLKKADGSPFDLSGCQIYSQLRKSVDAEEKVDFTCTIDPSPPTGRFTWVMVAAVTQNLEVRDYFTDMVLKLGDNTLHLLLEGRMKAQNKVTRDF